MAIENNFQTDDPRLRPQVQPNGVQTPTGDNNPPGMPNGPQYPDPSQNPPPQAPAGQPPAGGTPQTPSFPNPNNIDLTGIDPRLTAFFQTNNITPTARGTGNSDIAYWNDLLSQPGADWGYLQGRITGPSGGSGGGGGGGSMPFTPIQMAPYSPNQSIFGSNPGYGQAASDLLNFSIGRATGQISDSSLPALQVSPTDPIIRAQTDAYRTEETNAERNYLSNLAATSGPNTNIGAEGRAAAEQLGQSVAGFQANAMVNELNSRRAEIQSALTGAQGFVSNEQAMQLQEEAKQIDAQLAEMGLQERAYEFDTTNNNATYG